MESRPSDKHDPVPPRVQPIDAIGSLSVGHPHAGYLFNAVRMPPGRQWLLSVPDQAWGTEETIAALIHCIYRVNERFPDSPRVVIGSISARHGGALPPHKSHRTGRDADVHFYPSRPSPRWYEPATAENLDRARTWALLRAIITETDVEYVLIDRSVQSLLEEYALSVESDRAWVTDLFHGSGEHPRPLIKHIPGHTGHMHIRFYSPIAQERGRRAYDRLVEQGHVTLQQRQVKYEVEPGDTLSEIAERYHTRVDELVRVNRLAGTDIAAGSKLVLEEPQELRGARDKVAVPPRRLPRTAPAHDVGSVHARADAPAERSSTDTPTDAEGTLEATLLEVEGALSRTKP